MNHKLLFFLAAWLLAGMVRAQSLNDEEKPLLTVACISDIHTERSLIDCANLDDIALRGSFTRTLSLMKRDEKIDVMLLGGDQTSDATIPLKNWEKVRSLIASRTRLAFPSKTSTPVLYVSGNHDYEVANWDNIPKSYNAADYYSYPMKDDVGELSENDAFYEEADNGELGTMRLLAAYHYVIKGFDFVVLNGGKHLFKSAGNYMYSVESVQWVADKLEEIYAEDPNKTVFVAVHIPFSDSNSIRSSSKGLVSCDSEKLLKKTLSKYPNLIMLYGHDHGGDNAYTRSKTSQRVTRYDMSGNVIATTDATHVDGDVDGMEPEAPQEEARAFYLKNQANGKYLGYNTYNLAPVDSEVKITFTEQGGKGYYLELDAANPSASSNSFVHIGSNGYFSGGDASLLYVYELSDENATAAKRTDELKDGLSYLIVGKQGTNYYALSNETYNSGTAQRMQRVQVTLSDDLETLTLAAADKTLLWTFETAAVVEGGAVQQEETNWYVSSYATGEYLGFNTLNLGMALDANVATVAVTDAATSAFSVKVSGSGSEANGNYIISSSNGRFSANANTNPTYFFKVTKIDETEIVAEKVSVLESGATYVIVAENAKDRSLLYAITNEGYPATNSNRLIGLNVNPENGVIILDPSQTSALWKLEEAEEKSAKPSFFSAYMGSMRYYYNTIDPGDMPIETPNIVQALMIYVYADRVELHMKNYNRSGTINGITVEKELAPYISYRKVDLPTLIEDVKSKDSYTEEGAYDLLGRRVADVLSRGIRVVDGKKVLQK